MPAYDAERGAARADLCRLLAACYYQPGPEFAEEGVFDSIVAAASQVDPELTARAKRLRSAFAAEQPDELLLDYTRLFLGPSGIVAKPYGSVWLEDDGTVMGRSTVRVQALYEAGGFELDEGFREAPDHVAAELEFLYLLLFREADAHRRGDRDSARTALRLRRRLLDEHLGRWIGPFAGAVETGARCPFYAELAALTHDFVSREAALAR